MDERIKDNFTIKNKCVRIIGDGGICGFYRMLYVSVDRIILDELDDAITEAEENVNFETSMLRIHRIESCLRPVKEIVKVALDVPSCSYTVFFDSGRRAIKTVLFNKRIMELISRAIDEEIKIAG